MSHDKIEFTPFRLTPAHEELLKRIDRMMAEQPDPFAVCGIPAHILYPEDQVRERLIAECRVLGFTPDQADAECEKHGIPLAGLVHALRAGWTPDSAAHPGAYGSVLLNHTAGDFPEEIRQSMMTDHELTKKYVPRIAAAKTDEEADAIGAEWRAERKAGRPQEKEGKRP